MWPFFVLIFVLQGICIFVDEFYFHHKRRLPRWEIWGHPLDTLSVTAVFAIAAWTEYDPVSFKIYIGASIFSCLFVTKDEFVHSSLCSPAEMWLHAVLFILHPLSFIAAWILWSEGSGQLILIGQFLITFVFMTYQIFYWGKICQRLRRIQ